MGSWVSEWAGSGAEDGNGEFGYRTGAFELRPLEVVAATRHYAS